MFVRCPHCSAKFNVGSQHAGKKAKCAKCSGIIEIPEKSDKKSSPNGSEKTPGEDKKHEKTCPQCGEGVEPDTILCVSCGWNFQTSEEVQAGQISQPSQGKSGGSILSGLWTKKGIQVLLLIGFLAATVIVALMWGGEEPASERRTLKGFKFSVDDNNEVTITGYKGDDIEQLTIPAELGGKPVIKLGRGAFSGTDLESVTISEGIKKNWRRGVQYMLVSRVCEYP